MTKEKSYIDFINNKTHLAGEYGFDPTWIPDFLYDFQKHLLIWACKKGRSAIFADCGLGKTPIQLSWAENIVRKTNKKVLIFTPLAVSFQTLREANKFNIDAQISRDGNTKHSSKIVITNYERLHYFNSNDYIGVVCDESSILKNFDGVTRAAVTEFMRLLPYRLLCTATAAPNDYIELGTSSEALGELGYADMISIFFRKVGKTYTKSDEHRHGIFRLRGHATIDFWRWICSWARALQKPSDLGYPDANFILPSLNIHEHIVKATSCRDGWLFDLPAIGLQEQRKERRRTIKERCEKVASIVNNTGRPVICWCHLNAEGNLLEKLIPGAIEISGKDSDERKEEIFDLFQREELRVIVSKPIIAGFGLNWQHCAHQTFFPSHSFEQWYQAIRRSWRFGQKNEVTIDIITTEGESDVLKNLNRKQEAADLMFKELVRLMNDNLIVRSKPYGTTKEKVPSWL